MSRLVRIAGGIDWINPRHIVRLRVVEVNKLQITTTASASQGVAIGWPIFAFGGIQKDPERVTYTFKSKEEAIAEAEKLAKMINAAQDSPDA